MSADSKQQCVADGCQFYATKNSKHCSQHMPISELNRVDLKSAAQRQAVSEKLVRQTLLRHVQELYEARFSPFLMNDSDYQKFKHNITNLATTMAHTLLVKIFN
jgi:hypothetical protein